MAEQRGPGGPSQDDSITVSERRTPQRPSPELPVGRPVHDTAREAHASPLRTLTRSWRLDFDHENEAMFWVFVFPVLAAIGLGIAFRDRPQAAAPVAMTQRAAESQSRVHRALLSDADLDARTLPHGEAMDALREGTVDVVVDTNVEGDVDTDGEGDVDTDGDDGVDGNAKKTAPPSPGTGFVYYFDPHRMEGRLAHVLVNRTVQRALGQRDVIASKPLALQQRGSRYVDFLLPGLVGLTIMGSTMFGIGFAIVLMRRRRQEPHEATPATGGSRSLPAFILSRGVLVCVEIALILACGWLFFDVHIQGAMLTVIAFCMLGVTCFTGLSLLIAARLRSVELALGCINLVQMPMWILSGTFFPYERFPATLHFFIKLLPLTALNDLLRGVINDGAPWYSEWAPLWVLALWTGGTFALSLRLFRRR